jgi:hypothetical protein
MQVLAVADDQRHPGGLVGLGCGEAGREQQGGQAAVGNAYMTPKSIRVARPVPED